VDQAFLQALVAEMGITPDRVQGLKTATSFEEAKNRLDALKADVKANYKKLAFKYHPDRNNGDAEAEQKFKALAMVLRDIERLQVQPPRPPPVRVYWVRSYSSTHVSTNSTSTVTSTTFGVVVNNTNAGPSATPAYDARRVVGIRPV